MSAVSTRPSSELGTELPTKTIELTPTFVISTAIASRDFEDVHHDISAAQRAGLDNVFLNILTTSGICQQYVIEWAGPATIIEKSSLRLGLPAIAGDTLTLAGTVSARESTGEGRERLEVTVEANVTSGRHASAIVTCTVPESEAP
ncbi:MAG: MaoC/PaaZ C-terminal domain-containing protein [Nitriliruptorales bacterium]|nr:MaoC/PaaZ C-terminal domain-containing protein [Nitriliruptorales bacterium]